MLDGREQQITNSLSQKKWDYTLSEDPPLFPHGRLYNTGFANIWISGANSKIVEMVKTGKACQLTNMVDNEKNPASWFRGTKPRLYWETDFTEIKTKKM